VENAAGQGTNVGSSWEEVGRILDAIGGKRVGVTVDTQHAWAAGYDWRNKYDEVWDSFADAIGLPRLVAFHLNDSKMPLGSRVDRHDTVGEGQLGAEVFRRLVNDRRFDRAIGILETPAGPEGWKKEIAWLRGLKA
ncbi:MAG: deoxyribonuclease IV, partial [Thermoplasmatota archaeon]